MLYPGDIIGNRYKVTRLIGMGGASHVYEAEDMVLPRRWALKEFVPVNLNEEEIQRVRALFEHEVEILSGLRHTRLPCVGEAIHHNGLDYMAMEYIEGNTLHELIQQRQEPFGEEQVMAWSLEILEILEYLHHQAPPVIYRDLKPQNIIIDKKMGIRFIDFGIARIFNPAKQQDTIFMGTPGFAAPEQVRQRQSDTRSDIYSLGATMHYLLTLDDPGWTPFDFRPPSLANPHVTKLMENVVMKCLEIRAENRFQSATDITRVPPGNAP
jgi:serine/threonine-protein kinase